MKTNKLLQTTILLFVCFFNILSIQAAPPAFPGAEGFARSTTTGGRGGTVYHVNSLKDTNTEGTLRYAISKSGARTVIFDISGTIELNSELKINNGDLTIAGQTAPGDGICIKNYSVTVNASNVIIRFLRFRLGTDQPDSDGTIDRDAIWGRNQSNVIIDHCSMSWCTDECASFYGNSNFTMQWCILSESLRGSLHPKGYHGFGGIWGGQGATFHHNLIAHHDSRNPRMCGSRYTNRPDMESVDMRNNVFYNWGNTNSGYAAEGGSYNFINNYYKSGPATKSSIKYRIFQPNADDGSNQQTKGIYGRFYINGNYMEDKGANWDWNGIDIDNRNNSKMTINTIKSGSEFNVAEVSTHTAEKAFDKVLALAGASLSRDAVDARVTNEAKNRTYTYKGSVLGGLGIIDKTSDVGGWPTLKSTTPLTDTDKDGIPDSWEIKYGMDPNDASDRNNIHSSGYTYLEIYLNSLVENIMKSGSNDAINTIDEIYPSLASTSVAELTKTGGGSSNQTVTIGNAIANYGYSWTEATGATVTGLPNGVTATIDNNAKTITISGTPTSVGTYDITISTTGASTNAIKNAKITVIEKIISAKLYDFVVAQDGSGDFATIQAAIDACATNSTAPITIFIKNGTYKEKITLETNKTNIHFYGQDAEKVVFSWNDIGNDYNGITGVGTMNSASFHAKGTGFYAENVTFENSFGYGSQAVALRTVSDKQCFKNCKLLSFQDTHYAHTANARQYFLNCYIEGGTDYIFGGATVLYDYCEFKCLNKGAYVSAPSGSNRTYINTYGKTVPYGLILNECKITRANDVANASYYFMRPWKDNGSTVLINCQTDKHIKEAGWTVWSSDPSNDASDNHLTGYYAEYGTKDLNGNTINLSNRANWVNILNESDINNYYTKEKIFQNSSDTWNPIPLTVAPDAPKNVSVSGKSLSWDAVTTAKGYVVERNDYVVSFVTATTYEDITANSGTNYTYKIYAIGPNGNLSEKTVATPVSETIATLTKTGTGESSQTIALGESIVDFGYSWTNANTVNYSGFPNGLSVVINNNDKTVSISGTPTESGTFSFTITTVGATSNDTQKGTITVTAPATLTKHGAGSSSQNVERGNDIVSFYYTWENANTVEVTGLPNGITANIDNSAKSITIGGTANDEAGQYSYTITTVGGIPEASKTAIFTITSQTTDIDNMNILKTDINIYPNPITEEAIIFIQSPYNTIAIIEIVNITGIAVHTEKTVLNQGTNIINFQKDKLSSGIYFLKMTLAKENITKRIIIK